MVPSPAATATSQDRASWHVAEPAAPAASPPAPPRRLRAPEGRDAATLYRLHGAVVYRRCLRLLRDREAARDATQEVFLRLVRDELHLFSREDVLPWLYRVATNHCHNLRRAARHRAAISLDDAPEPTCPASDRLDHLLAERILARFDAVTRYVAVAVLVDEQEQEEVAQALGLSRRTAARKLERFLEQARRHLVATGEAAAGRR